MKSIKKIVVPLLLLVFIVNLFVGCGKDNNKTATKGNDETTTTTTTTEGTTDVAATPEVQKNTSWDTFEVDPEKFKGKTLSIWKWWDMSEDELAKKAKFEELTGATIEWVNVPWSEYGEKLISSVSAGTGPDICIFGPESMPTFILKNIILPVSDYVDFESPAFTVYSPQAKKILDYYTLDGKTYAIMDAGPRSFRLYYRKDLLENAGLEDPYDLFMNGEWTWDKWFELMEGVTQDLDGDGVVDIWGFDAWTSVAPFVLSNGADYVVDGKFAADDPKFIEALDKYRELKQSNYVWKPWEEGKDPQGNLIAGATCFNYWGAWELTNLRENIGDNLGFVPFPKGPSATNEMSDIYDSTVNDGIAASSQNPELAGAWLEFIRLPETVELWELKQEENRQADILNYGSEELVDLAMRMGSEGVVDGASSYPGLSDVITKMIDDTTKSSTQAANEYLAAGQAVVDETMKAK